MTIIFTVIGVAIVLGVWAIYLRLGVLFEILMRESKANSEWLKQELAILWIAVSSDPDDRAKRRKEFGLGPLYLFDEEMKSYLWPHRERYQHLAEELKQLESRTWDYKDAADRELKTKQREELRLEVLVRRASANPEQKAAWDKLQEDSMRQGLDGLLGAKEPKK